MDELGFEELPEAVCKLLRNTGLCNELSGSEIAQFILESDELAAYGAYTNPVEIEVRNASGTVAHAVKTRKSRR